MARRLRMQFAGAIYHVTMRGIEQRAVFRDDRDRARFLARVGEDVATHGVRYRQFVERGWAEADAGFLDALKRSNLALGTEAFRDRVQQLHCDLLHQQKRREDVAFRRIEARLPAEDILRAVSAECGVGVEALQRRTKGSAVRAVAAKMLVKYGGLTQRAVANRMGVRTGAAVSIQIKNLAGRAANDRRLQQQLARLEQKLAEQLNGAPHP